MKGNIKKLALLLIITVIATFILAATVPADASGHRAIRGQYTATGGGTCLVAYLGFDNLLVPIDGIYDLMTFSIEAVFTFTRDGTGHVERTCPTVTHNPSPFALYPSAAIAKDSWDFTYAVEPDGSITLTQVPGTHTGEFISGPLTGFTYNNESRNRRGTVSPDGKTIILNGGSPDFVTNSEGGAFQMICNDSAVLIWQHN